MLVVGVNPGGLFGGDSAAILTHFREQTGATFPLGWDTSGSYSQFRAGGGASISPFPLDVVVDRDGIVRYISREYDPAELTAVIESLLAQ